MDGGVVVIHGETMGSGPDDLGRTLMASFLRTLCGASELPHAIVFYNAGVRLLAEGSPVLDALKKLESRGVDLPACGTCVSYFGLGDSLRAGRVSTMQELASLLTGASRVTTI
jgi:selenium metabolism protein YedF